MNFPSPQFDDAIAALCHGTSTDDQLSALHRVLRSNTAAQEKYIWHVELHSRLTAHSPLEGHNPFLTVPPQTASTAQPRRTLIAIAAIAALLFIAFFAGTYFAGPNPLPNPPGAGQVAIQSVPTTMATTQDQPPIITAQSSPHQTASAMYIIPPNCYAAVAATAPVVVANGGKDPIHLGAYLPYAQPGTYLHVWDWSKSPLSHPVPNLQWRDNIPFTLSPDGKLLLLASGEIVDLQTDKVTRIDLGGATYHAMIDEHLLRIRDLQFSPDGRRLALLVSQYEFTPSDNPLRKGN